MASPTKIIETIRARKRNKLRKARNLRVRKETMKEAQGVDADLRRFIPNTRA